MTSKIDKLLAVDPLALAERMTGISYKDETHGEGFDNPTILLGLALMQDNAAAKAQAMLETDDTMFSNELPRYRRIIEKFGFEEVLADPWRSKWEQNETFYVFAHRDGLLLSFDTFDGNHVNGGKVYYNWRPAVDNPFSCTSSGHMTTGGVWIGDHDCREALIHNLNKLRNCGDFVCPWVERPFLWLLNFDEPKVAGYDHETITQSRIDRLPQWVRDFIN